MAIDPLSAGIMGVSFVSDVIGGASAKRKNKKRFRDFQRSLIRREREQVNLERIARGEVQASLAEGRELFSETMKAISASNSVASRRLMEDINRREAEAEVRARHQGMMGSSATSTQALAREREVFRAALDAEANRSARMGQVLQAQAGFELDAGQTLAQSYRREGQIGAESGREYRRAVENTQVTHSPVTPGVAQLLAQMGMLGGKEDVAAAKPSRESGVTLPLTGREGLKHPSMGAGSSIDYDDPFQTPFQKTTGGGLFF